MKIVMDSDIPYVAGIFEPFADVLYVKGCDITAGMVSDADAIIVRTRTRCDRALLENSKISIVVTATIGLDHIDLQWCASAGIEVRSAAGSNARAVAQWVMAAMFYAGIERGVVGIVGLGNVGGEVERMAAGYDFDVLRCDPPRAANGESGFVSLEELLAASDVVTLHVPLLASTKGMVDDKFLSTIKSGALLLNSSRGEVVDENALLAATTQKYGLDVWQNEPDINVALMNRAVVATPHIAGYSARGKARATQMAVCAIADFFGIDELKNIDLSSGFELEQPDRFDIGLCSDALRQNYRDFENLRTIRV